jgi:hypothetical protein
VSMLSLTLTLTLTLTLGLPVRSDARKNPP